jgi:hypothetical protein
MFLYVHSQRCNVQEQAYAARLQRTAARIENRSSAVTI